MISIINYQNKYLKNPNNKLSADIKKGDFVTIYGESGVGKTTLLKHILNIKNNYKGKIIFENDNFSYLPQKNLILKNSSVKRNIELGLRLRNLSIDKSKVIDLFSKLNLQKDIFYRDNCYNLSEGEKRRILLIRELLVNSDILILDEPLESLNMESKVKVLKLLKKLVKVSNKTIIMTSHDEISKKYSSKIIRLN